MNKTFIWAQCLLYIFISSSFFAQESPRVFSFSDELITGNQVWSISQAPDHKLYFGTSKGLLSFDGSNWEQCVGEEKEIIRAVAVANEGHVYVGAYNQFGFWEKDMYGVSIYHPVNQWINSELPVKEEIWNIVSRNDIIYFQSFSTIYKYDSEKVDVLTPPGNIMFLQKIDGDILFQVIDNGLYELTSKNSFRFIAGTEFLADKKVVFILPSDNESILIGTEQNGVFLFRDGQYQVWNTTMQNDFKANELNKGIRLSSGNYAFGSILDGLYLLDKNGNLLNHISRQNGLQNNTVLSLYEDKSANLWVGLDKGTNLIELNAPLSFYHDKEGGLGSLFTAIIFKGFLYLGTNHGVYYKEWIQGNPGMKGNDFKLIEGTQGQVWELKDYDGQLFCGHNEGTFLIKDNRAVKISNITGGWTSLMVPSRKDILIQGTYSGIVVFNKTQNGKWQFSHRANGFNEPIKRMVIDEDDYLWVANPIEGLHRIKLDEEFQNINYLYKFTTTDSLPFEKFIELSMIDHKVSIKSGPNWLSFDRVAQKLIKNDTLREVHIANQDFYLFEGSGKDWFQAFDHKIVYHADETKKEFEIALVRNFENIIDLKNSTYLFCLDDGYALFDRTKSEPNFQLEPSPEITKVEVTGKHQRFVPLRLSSEDQIALLWDENNLIFHFAGHVFDQKSLFMYRLEGEEASFSDWSDWSGSTSCDYNNLSAGNYTFHVKSNLSRDETSFSFTILPHWSESNGIKVLYLLGVLGFFWWIMYFQKSQLKKAKSKIEAEQKRIFLEQQMTAKNERLELEVLSKSKELANSTINLAQKNEILLQLKKELKDLRNMSNVSIPSKEYQHLLTLIERNLSSDQDWELFEKNFNQVHESFLKRLKLEFTELTSSDLQLAAYLKMNLSSKEIAPLLHISIRGVENKRYRLRKKLGLPIEDNLNEFMLMY